MAKASCFASLETHSGPMSYIFVQVYTRHSRCTASKRDFAPCRTYVSPLRVLPVWVTETSTWCRHVMTQRKWKGALWLCFPYEDAITVRVVSWPRCLPFCLPAENRSLQAVPWGTLPKSEILSSIYEFLLLMQLRLLLFDHFAVRCQSVSSSPHTVFVGQTTVLFAVVSSMFWTNEITSLGTSFSSSVSSVPSVLSPDNASSTSFLSPALCTSK